MANASGTSKSSEESDTPALDPCAQTSAESSQMTEASSTSEPGSDRAADRAYLDDYLRDTRGRWQWKSSLRNENVACLNNRPEETEWHKLDSSLRKNTAFVRKLRNYTEAQKETLAKEFQQLNLSKYIGEVSSALVEAKLKLSDLGSAIELCSQLHQRYPDFASHFLESWTKILTAKTKDEKVTNLSKFRVDLRFYADCVSVGLFPLKDGLQLLGQVLTHLVQSDKEDMAHVSLILTFSKHCGDDYAGLVPRRIQALAHEFGIELPSNDFLPPEKQRNVRSLLTEYFHALGTYLQNAHRELATTDKANRSILLTKGELFQDRKDKAEALRLSFQKCLGYAEQLAELLNEPMPEFHKDEVTSTTKGKPETLDCSESLGEEVDQSALGRLWEDDETKCFYESLVELEAIIPAILYKDCRDLKTTERKSVQEVDEALLDVEVEGDDDLNEEVIQRELEANPGPPQDEEEAGPPNIDEDIDEAEGNNPSAKMMFDAFLAKLATCVSREMVDSAAIEFCMNHNTKANRKKLVKAAAVTRLDRCHTSTHRALFNVHRNRTELLPFYARLTAALEPVMPEVPDGLGSYLKQEFRWQIRKKDQMKIESKLKVCRFIGEMVKFRVFPKSEVLFCLKMLLFDFSHHHIEMACTLMETCGRFLFRSPESHHRTKIFLEQMMRKKAAFSMDNRYVMMIENAYYNVQPPDVPDQDKQVKLPIYQYIDKILFLDLNRQTTEKVLKLLRKLDWNDDPNLANYVISSLCSAWKVKYYNIQYLGSLLAGLVSYQDWIGPRIVDAVLEDIRLHMEINDPKYNQRRISMVKFLAELYNYRLVDSSVIFKVLYSLISYGVVSGDNEVSFLDPPDHLLRIRLVCVILDTCGIYFNSGSSKKKLQYFSTYWQAYYWSKREHPIWNQQNPFPISISNQVLETLANLRPKLTVFSSIEGVKAATTAIENEILATLSERAPQYQKYIQDSRDSSHSSDESDDEFAESDMDSDELPDVSKPRHIECEDDEDFVSLFDKMLLDNISENRAPTKGHQIDIIAPVSVKHKMGQATINNQPNMDVTEGPQLLSENTEGSIQFTILHRRGNKPAMRSVAVPLNSDIARNLQKQEEADRREKERVKELTLQINERQEEEDLNEAIAS
eukprot:TCALIF_05453-PA protein Name:"Similar to UPF2 Regulator of nonsense transcripts 2 (Homo sapiens)" AED:0.09 eAED:0.10 QI:511/0.66/0.6/1/1/1/10/0/1134